MVYSLRCVENPFQARVYSFAVRIRALEKSSVLHNSVVLNDASLFVPWNGERPPFGQLALEAFLDSDSSCSAGISAALNTAKVTEERTATCVPNADPTVLLLSLVLEQIFTDRPCATVVPLFGELLPSLSAEVS